MKKHTRRLIAQLGNPILRQKSTVVRHINKKEIQQLIDDMIVTVQEVDGIGIAAPQVYNSQQIFIVVSKPNPHYPHAPNRKPVAMINPEILISSISQTYDWEGCLSIPGIRGYVPRCDSLKIRYTSRTGKIIQKILHGFIARIFQHEYDHLHGLVFLDKLDSVRFIVSEKEYQQMVRKKYDLCLTQKK